MQIHASDEFQRRVMQVISLSDFGSADVVVIELDHYLLKEKKGMEAFLTSSARRIVLFGRAPETDYVRHDQSLQLLLDQERTSFEEGMWTDERIRDIMQKACS